MRGIGEILTPCRSSRRPSRWRCLPSAARPPAVYARGTPWAGPTADGPNDLEPAALRVEPRLAAWRDTLGDATGETPVLAGSGSTWFVRGDYPERGPDRDPRTIPEGPRRASERPGQRGARRSIVELALLLAPQRGCQRVRFSIFLCFFLRIRFGAS